MRTAHTMRTIRAGSVSERQKAARLPCRSFMLCALFLPFLLFAGCKLFSERQPDATATFTLTPEIQDPSSASDTATTATLLVSVPRARPGYDNVQMAYIRRPHEIEYFARNQWADTPARMLAPLLVKAIERTGRWAAVVQMPTAVRADDRLDTEDLVLEHDFLTSPSRIHIGLRAQLSELGAQRIVASRWFDVYEDAEPNPYGGVVAANKAAGALLKQIAEWASRSKRAEPARRR